MCQALCTAWCPAGVQLLLTWQDCGTGLGSREREGALSSALTWGEALSRRERALVVEMNTLDK